MDYAAYLIGQEHPYTTLAVIGALGLVGLIMWSGVHLWRTFK